MRRSSLVGFCRIEIEADRIDAVPQVGRGVEAFTGENVSEVGVTSGTSDLRPWAPRKGLISEVTNPVLGQWRVKGRPTAAGLEFLGGAKQLRPAGATAIDALGSGVGVFPHEGSLGACLPQHVVFLVAETLTPLIGCQHETRLQVWWGGVLVGHDLLQPGASRRFHVE